jgi:rfaE bifunctional protein nucleotidyltransferase chain/domain
MKNQKIKTQEEIKKIAEELRKEGKRIVTTNGSFDILHIGHVKFLEEAKEQGDVLIVGLNSDESIKQYKSKDRPIIPEQYRIGMLAALECVDYVVLFNQPEIAVPLINIVRPDIHVNGEEYGVNCVEAEAIKNIGGRLYLIKNFEGFSTTNLIKKILDVYKNKNHLK